MTEGVRGSFLLPCSLVSPLALSRMPFSSRKDNMTSRRPQCAADFWPFFCLCLLYIPVVLVTDICPPFPRSHRFPLALFFYLGSKENKDWITRAGKPNPYLVEAQAGPITENEWGLRLGTSHIY